MHIIYCVYLWQIYELFQIIPDSFSVLTALLFFFLSDFALNPFFIPHLMLSFCTLFTLCPSSHFLFPLPLPLLSLQEHYNTLLTKYAEAENTIDRLRLEAKVVNLEIQL